MKQHELLRRRLLLIEFLSAVYWSTYGQHGGIILRGCSMTAKRAAKFFVSLKALLSFVLPRHQALALA